MRGRLLDWFTNYLSDRSQKVSINGVLSVLMFILAGVPQGCILGPLLFIVYINDVILLIEEIIRLFADDSMMISIGVDQLDCVMKLQPALDAFIAWAVHWKIKINPSKTKVITFERSNSDQINLAIAGDPFREVFTHCHLGLHLQRDLKWSTQIESMLVKAEERLKILRYHRYNFNAKTLQNMYISYIYIYVYIYIYICTS